MVRLHSSFMVRCWFLDGGQQRIELEHIQTGAKALFESMAEAVAWMGVRTAGGHRPSDDGDEPAIAREGRIADREDDSPDGS